MTKNNVRTSIQEIVASLTALDKMEQDHINFVHHWIDSGCELFRTEKPATPDIHLVCYFVLVSPGTNQILLTDHKASGLWLPSGGHVEPGEHPTETVKREAKEELGIDPEFLFEEPLFLTVTKTVGNMTHHTDVSLWYLLKGDPIRYLEYDRNEFNQIHWFKINDIPFHQSDPHMGRFIQKMVKQIEGKSAVRAR
jgi:8-oxo-dGTP diphosphatase